MLARLLYAAVALCALGTFPGRAAMRASASADLASPAPAAAEIAAAPGAASAAGGTSADFAIPPKHR